MLKRFLAVTAAALVLFAGACGDDDDDDDATTGGDTTTTAAAGGGGGDVEFVFDLTGAAEVPGPGDPDGEGRGGITLKAADNQVCFGMEVRNIATASAAHIHEGATGVAGPIVVTLDPPVNDNAAEGCKSADAALIGRIVANPAGFYVNVHNAEYPNGAVRGQLREDTGPPKS